MGTIPYIGKRMTREEFRSYLKSLTFGSFKPRFVTLHHTGQPNLANRPNGLSNQHLLNLKHYYENTMDWNGAPHVFVDDQGDGIILFQRMDRRGVHAVSFNRNSWGVEMLGYYDRESFDTGRGAKVRDNSMAALAIMCEALGVEADTIKFHRDDPKTTKTCPGLKVTKADVVSRVAALMNTSVPEDTTEDNDFVIVLPDGKTFENTRLKDGRLMVRARDFLMAIDPNGTLVVRGRVLTWGTGNIKPQIQIAEIDEKGAGWVFVRDVAVAKGLKITVDQKKIVLT
jgi:hypothetical protein